MGPWIAAPVTTVKSGSVSVRGRRPNNFDTIDLNTDILVAPPTNTTSSIADISSPASRNALSIGDRTLINNFAVASLKAISSISHSWVVPSMSNDSKAVFRLLIFLFTVSTRA
jgi:hypothetical protein